ncbi:sodium channel protein Nach-like [Culicoides brevitarsis]|uniref:sodium channel protein Nach-like n=1 Tax=Culicoides brevitarsis TaxID=469753 RepID=UPI00307BC74D
MIAMAKELKNPVPNATVDDTLEILKLLSGYIDLNTYSGENFEDLDKLLAYNKLKIDQIVPKLMPVCGEMIQRCYWLGTEVRCDAFFEQTVTFLGACCSFNYVGAKSNHTTSRKFEASSILNQAKVVTTSGTLAGLIVVLNPLFDDYFYTRFRVKGFRVIVHDSYDYPELNSPTVFVKADAVSYVNVLPEAIYSTDEIYGKDVMIRECYDENEIRLNVMKHYSFINCMVECRRLIAYSFCGCIPYNYPRNGTLPTCNATQVKCVIKHNGEILNANPIVKHQIDLMPELPISSSCNCLPSCKYYQYAAQVTHGRLRFNQSVKSQNYL